MITAKSVIKTLNEEKTKPYIAMRSDDDGLLEYGDDDETLEFLGEPSNFCLVSDLDGYDGSSAEAGVSGKIMKKIVSAFKKKDTIPYGEGDWYLGTIDGIKGCLMSQGGEYSLITAGKDKKKLQTYLESIA